MQKRHKNREQYFEEQVYTSKKYVLPLVNNLKSKNDLSILEIGCGEGGNLLPFYESKKYNRIVGIDMSLSKIENGKKFYSKKGNLNNIEFIHSDIYDIKPTEFGKFDVIITRDVLEHIHGHEKFLFFTKKLLKKDGIFFLGFPPWHNPFGGHQQMCKSKILSRLPFFHILPKKIYRTILKLFGESNIKILNLLEIKQTGITIEKFEKITRKTEYNILKRIFYFINPNYEIKFGLKPRISSKLISSVPYLRNFFITTNYYIISPKK